MKKFLVLAVLAFAGYQLYQHGPSFFSPKGAFDAQGKPLVMLFVGPGCGEACGSVRVFLEAHNVAFEEVDIEGADGASVAKEYGVKGFPTTFVGGLEIRGNDMPHLTSALAEAYGSKILSRKESRLMAKHFDASGRAEVVMYATQWCQYCKKQREFFADKGIAYREIDVEASQENTQQYNAFEAGGYPLIFVGYRRFEGYHEADLMAAIAAVKKADPRL